MPNSKYDTNVPKNDTNIDSSIPYSGCGRELVDDQKVLMLISVGQPAHEGASLEATYDYLVRNYQRQWRGTVTILVADWLQRFSLMLEQLRNLEEQDQLSLKKYLQDGQKEANVQKILTELEQKALDAGERWVEMNQENVDTFKKFAPGITVNVVRWQNWILQAGYSDEKEKMVRLYQENHDFKKSVETNVTAYLLRKGKGRVDNDFTREIVAAYRLEELTLYEGWSRIYDFTLYPNNMPADFKWLYENHINSSKGAWLNFKLDKEKPTERKCVSGSNRFFHLYKEQCHQETSAQQQECLDPQPKEEPFEERPIVTHDPLTWLNATYITLYRALQRGGVSPRSVKKVQVLLDGLYDIVMQHPLLAARLPSLSNADQYTWSNSLDQPHILYEEKNHFEGGDHESPKFTLAV